VRKVTQKKKGLTPKNKSKNGKSKSPKPSVHPWRVYPYGEHWVRTHPLTVPPLNDPNVNICAGVRWLFEKRRLTPNHLKRAATWLETFGNTRALSLQKPKRTSRK
jgi:hypothetical protein